MAGDPPQAQPAEDERGTEEDRQLEPLERPVATGGLVGHNFVIRGGNLHYTVLKRLLNTGGHLRASGRPRGWGPAVTDEGAGARDELGGEKMTGLVDDLG